MKFTLLSPGGQQPYSNDGGGYWPTVSLEYNGPRLFLHTECMHVYGSRLFVSRLFFRLADTANNGGFENRNWKDI